MTKKPTINGETDNIVATGSRSSTSEPGSSSRHLYAGRRLASYRRQPEQITEKQVRKYLLYLIESKGYAKSTLNIDLCAIKFLYRRTLGPKPQQDTLHKYKQDWASDRAAAPVPRQPAVRLGTTHHPGAMAEGQVTAPVPAHQSAGRMTPADLVTGATTDRRPRTSGGDDTIVEAISCAAVKSRIFHLKELFSYVLSHFPHKNFFAATFLIIGAKRGKL
jgi:hypothetical protein